ncbi:MAG: sigma-54 dependent transcriptional regulator [Candidatus Acidiferrum sp.]
MAAAATPTFVRFQKSILVASADSSFRRRLMKSSACAGSLSEEAVGGAHALAKLAQFTCDSVLLDRHLPDLDSTEVAELIRQRYPSTEVKFVDSKLDVAQPEEFSRVTGFENGKANSDNSNRFGSPHPADRDEIGHSRLRLNPAVAEVAETLPGMLGTSRAMQQVYRMARMVAPRDTTVLITGETGTGKELVAEAIHKLSPRASHPFVAVNCAAIPESLFEAELFGYARGAFTGAVQSRLGRIHVAQGGTLFLDEAGEMPLSMQAKLLRFLQNGEVQRLGSSDVYRVDVRVVCATNRELLEQVHAKEFRQDLYYRLAIFPLAVPPLRERMEDIGILSEHFLSQLSAENKMARKYLTTQALTLLQQSRWEGNVRELQHAIERAFILSGNEDELRAEHFQAFSESVRLREI